VQDNHSFSIRNTLRGLHYQVQRPQGKLVRAVAGTIWMLLWICDAAQVRLAEQKPFSCPMSTNTCYGCRPASGTAFVSFPRQHNVTYKSTGSILLPTNARLRGMIPILRLTGSLKLHRSCRKKTNSVCTSAMRKSSSRYARPRVRASGMLGRDLLAAFSEDDATGLSSRQADLRDSGSVLSTVQQARPDWIILAAAYTDVDGWRERSGKKPWRSIAMVRQT